MLISVRFRTFIPVKIAFTIWLVSWAYVVDRFFQLSFLNKMARNNPELIAFNEITLTEIGARFKYNTQRTIEWCRRYGLVAKSMICPNCVRDCNQQNLARNVDGCIWRCPNKQCRKMINIRKDSFFEGSHLQLWQVWNFLISLCLWYWISSYSIALEDKFLGRFIRK